jgi:hypothetical protein
MASPGSLTGRLPPERHGAPGKRFLARLCALLAGPRYDAELADGISPTTSIGLGARAARITTVARAAGSRGRSGELWRRRNGRPDPGRLDSKVPVDAVAVQTCKDDVLALAETLARIERPPARGVAIARQLVSTAAARSFYKRRIIGRAPTGGSPAPCTRLGVPWKSRVTSTIWSSSSSPKRPSAVLPKAISPELARPAPAAWRCGAAAG